MGWPRTVVLSISASEAAGITGVSHHAWPEKAIFLKLAMFNLHSVIPMAEVGRLIMKFQGANNRKTCKPQKNKKGNLEVHGFQLQITTRQL
jgi:hypothetical protein